MWLTMRTTVIMLAAIMACTVAGSPVAPVASELDNDVDGYAGRSGWYYTKIVDEAEDTKIKERAPQNDVDGYAGRSGWYYTKIADGAEDSKVEARAPQNDVDGYAGRSGWYYTKKVEEDD
ncbi:hypothetical protein SLS63_011882 [Diaporthe eres]|uniref:Uncharacterized protein n=1 Tax=Diaporthe eres TaxID=83184 RepID=A0ABR1NSV7_DIAER